MRTRQSQTFRGQVIRHMFAAGSKSQHQAVCLQTDAGHIYLLRIAGAPTFSQPEFEAFVGQTVCATGEVLHGNTLLLADLSNLSVSE